MPARTESESPPAPGFPPLDPAVFRQMAEDMPQLAWITRADGWLIWLNRRWCEYTGTTLEANLGWGWLEVHEPATVPRILPVWQQALATGSFYEVECSMRGVDGRYRPFLVRGVPVKDAAGVIQFWFGTNTEITELREAQALAAEREERFRTLVESLPQLVWSCRPDGECDYLSPQWVEFTGIPAAEQLGYGWLDALHPDDRATVFARWQHCARTGDTFDVTFRIRHAADGSYRHFATRAAPMHDADGRIVKWFGTNTDIEDAMRMHAELVAMNQTLEARVRERTAALEQANTRLREAEEFTRRWLNLTTDGVWDWNLLTDDEYLSPRFKELFGYRDEELPNRAETWQRLMHPDDLPRTHAALREHREHGTPFSVPVRYRHRDGSYVWVICRGVAIADANGQFVRMIGTHTDITALKAAEEELLCAKAAAERANKAKSDFLAAMSHEIRTPLNGVVGYCDLLLDSPLPLEQRDLAESARNSAELLSAVVNDILDFSKIEADRIELDELFFNVRHAVQESVAVLAARAAEKHLFLHTAFADDAPEEFLGDLTRFRQILLNLVGNAVKFTEHGSVTVRVTPSATFPEGLRVEVCDTGIGISEEQQRHLFEPFTQGDRSTNRRFGGTGLGLAIAQRLARAMGGTLGLHSVPGEGTTFWLDLPRRTATRGRTAPPPPARLTAPPAGREFAKAHPLRILLVEDNVSNRRLFRLMLERLGYTPDLAENGAEAIAAVRQQAYDVILMDVQMPEVDGYEATRRILALRSPRDQPRVIALTAHAAETDRARCRAVGMSDFLTKPLRPQELVRVLVAAFDHVRGSCVTKS